MTQRPRSPTAKTSGKAVDRTSGIVLDLDPMWLSMTATIVQIRKDAGPMPSTVEANRFVTALLASPPFREAGAGRGI